MMTSHKKYTYKAITGYFGHDSLTPSRAARVSTTPGLGLIDRQYETDSVYDPNKEKTQWERFSYFLSHLNEKEAGKAEYKLLFLTRHGEGYHNVQEAKVGTEAWDAHWSKLEGDGSVVWADADLTATGKAQALALNTFWQSALEEAKVPAPEVYYVSPHSRTLETCKLSFSGLSLPIDRPFKPTVKENLRERYGEHTCDRRRSRTWIAEHYPEFNIEDGLTESDELWMPEGIETPEHTAGRLTKMLDDLFEVHGNGGSGREATFISFTMHSWAIFALHMAVGHEGVWVMPGAMVPLLVRAELDRE